MSEDRGAPQGAGERRRGGFFADLSPLRQSPAFARLWAGSSIAGIGAQVTVVTVGLHIYHLTQSTLAVSLVALWAIGPMIIAGLYGGMLADVFDRRKLALFTAIAAWGSIGVMTVIAFLGVEVTWPYYALAAVNASAATILGATRSAILPRILPLQLLPAAAALGGIGHGFSVTLGPAIAGLSVAGVGYAWTYLIDVVLFSAAFLGIASLPPIEPEGNAARPGLRSLVEGWDFLRKAPNIRATFLFDIIAMTLGQPRVVFPAAGALVLGGGAVTVGLLTAAYAIGSLLCGVFSGRLGAVRRQGRAVTQAIAAYGAAIACFGVVLCAAMLFGQLGETGAVRVLPLTLACLALAAAGAADEVSAVFRSTILQAAAPDDVRGRRQGIFFVVVAGGPRVGDLYAGLLATAVALWAPPLIGGLAIIALMLVLARAYRSFLTYDARHPQP